MRVKRLEIQGFKSFKDKTVIHFDHSITGIVGPNGCGKSNIVDAFFWVMGEQSYKHMRGSSSDDLIFNGSSKYSPLGMAEATMVLETDVVDTANAPLGASASDISLSMKSKEVSVTRRLYRDGDGEYFMNGQAARLKDIQELFMDTGVGAKGYSVIEQGQIGKIVNAKPEERRLLIEEAAGIAKYKARKKESLRKMDAAQANLARLTDIIQEIEKNLGSLDRQAQKARLYKKYKDELLDKEMTWGRRKRQVYTQKLEALKTQRDALEQELVALKAELQTSENTIEVDRVHLVTESKEAEAYQLQIQELSEQLSQEKSALELSRRRQGDLSAQLESLHLEKEELSAALEKDAQTVAENALNAQESDDRYQKAASEAKALEAILNQMRQKVNEARLEQDSHQRELRQSLGQISDLSSRISAFMGKTEAAQIQSERIAQQLEIQQEKIVSIQGELEKSKSASQSVQQQKQTLQEKKREQSLQIQSQEQELKRLENERTHSLKTLTQLKSKLQSLEELAASHEGLADGPKAALDWAKANGKSREMTALTDQLRVDPGFESVLECWLEKRIENLILQDSSLAFLVLEKIKNSKQGRVNFQLLSEQFQPKELQPSTSFDKIQSLLESHGFKVLGELTKFVQIESKSAASLQHLFAHVCVVESSQPMTEFFNSSDFSQITNWAIIGMDGVVLESQGLMRGGSLNATGAVGILRRKRSIEELTEQVSTAEKLHQELEVSVENSKRTVDELRANRQQMESELQSLEIQFAGLERDVLQTERAVQEAKKQKISLEQNFEQITSETEKAIQDRQEMECQLQELVMSRTELEENISSSDQNLHEHENKLREEEAQFQALRINEASARERAYSLKRELEAARSVIADRERRLKEVNRILERASHERAEFSGSESELAEKVETLVLALTEVREKLSAVKDQIEQANAKVNASLEKTKELHKKSDAMTTESNQLALEFEKISGDLSHLVQNLEEKYGPGCLDLSPTSSPSTREETAENLDQPDADGPQENLQPESGPIVIYPNLSQELSTEEELILGEQVERLRERIRRLGEVNVMAIEEYEVLKKRFDHLQNEKLDLERSMENLKEAIEHINKTSEERFRKAFAAIAERFERLFPIIFGGGQAKLSLIYPEGSTDILEAGVDILAQPPGKKIANITLLSGGEKALTAVSLIFAIFMVKPSPFCVLDEVDAPLDDANIGKFNALLREMSVKSQFILITHNKKTMELNDTLYGVTMEEPGVSKMVSIEMR